MTPKTPGVPLCELKGWPEKIKICHNIWHGGGGSYGCDAQPRSCPQCGGIENATGIKYNFARNETLKELGNKRLSFDLEAFAKALYEGRYPYGSWADRKDYQRTYWINKARHLAEPAIKSIHLSDGEGNDA